MASDASFYGGAYFKGTGGSSLLIPSRGRVQTLQPPYTLGNVVKLPGAVGQRSGGPYLVLVNPSASDVDVQDATGGVVATLNAGSIGIVLLVSAASLAGKWFVNQHPIGASRSFGTSGGRTIEALPVDPAPPDGTTDPVIVDPCLPVDDTSERCSDAHLNSLPRVLRCQIGSPPVYWVDGLGTHTINDQIFFLTRTVDIQPFPSTWNGPLPGPGDSGFGAFSNGHIYLTCNELGWHILVIYGDLSYQFNYTTGDRKPKGGYLQVGGPGQATVF